MSKSKPKSRPTSLKVVITADMLDKRDEEAPEEKDDRLPHEVILDDINDRHLEEVARDERYEMRKYLLSWCWYACHRSSARSAAPANANLFKHIYKLYTTSFCLPAS